MFLGHAMHSFNRFVSDIDECTNHKCNNATTLGQCLNTIGSFECKCRDGHQRINETACEGEIHVSKREE